MSLVGFDLFVSRIQARAVEISGASSKISNHRRVSEAESSERSVCCNKSQSIAQFFWRETRACVEAVQARSPKVVFPACLGHY